MTRTGMHRLTLNDLPLLLQIQAQTLPDTLSARLGSRFNVLFHQSMLNEDQYLCYACFVDGSPVGYLSCTPDSQSLLRSAVRRQMPRYVATLAYALLSNARLWGLASRIAFSVVTGRGEPARDVGAELLSFGVLPSFRGRKTAPDGTHTSVAGTLVQRALESLHERGSRSVKACVVPDDETANAFFRKHGFDFESRIRRFGLTANLYVHRLDPPIAAPSGG
ncbi:MAG: GNAT family N-acetyltransferase [Gemmatimonadaceae bacterium]